MGRGRGILVAVAVVLGAVGSAEAAVPRSTDSEAPKNAPAHWLPPEPWVYNHWIPYDEGRLYRTLKITRGQLWQQLRDDRRTLAQLAARKGWRDTGRLARVLVAPRAAKLGPRRAAELRDRAERTLTQGHLAQHVFFHSLHQFAIPSAAPDIFGVTDAAFRELRRRELSPLAIGRLHGRSPGAVQAGAIAVLRERAAAGVREGAFSRSQADLLLQRQLTQLPRWLGQARYNGPPVTHRGELVEKPRDYASNPAISLDGRFVAYEGYRQNVPQAVALGEIAVLRTDLETFSTELVSGVHEEGPASAYNPAISADGALVTFESSAGNKNFAKRYGRIATMLCDLRKDETEVVDLPDPEAKDSKSSFNPRMAANATRMVYQAVRDERQVVLARDLPGGATRTAVKGAAAGGTRYADPYEPAISADGSRIAYTLVEGDVRKPSSAGSSVRVLDLRDGRTRVAGGGAGFAADPALSPDGRFVAYTASKGREEAGLFLHDLEAGTTVQLPTGGARVLDPVVGTGGAVVAFTRVRGGKASIHAWSAATGTTQLVSRASGEAGAAGDGWSEKPSISGDGRRVVFASTATNLDPLRRDGARAIYLRDLLTQTTRAVSDLRAAYEVGR